ncbi:hypothetical protein DdX_06848 [Ditylenchus destructor]|uniref:Uncharacterized protein n=1 Tax=Ditylenchus destructor TaxID=166010 RepID=A0AAD4R598_9BILA|nr:hypothetical protein DdX_06848 [Ditylenchus destructor]
MARGNKVPRPYVKSSLKLDLHIQENSNENATKALCKISRFLTENGFQRSISSGKKSKTGEMKEEPPKIVEASTSMAMEENAVQSNRTILGVIGFRCVLKALNRDATDSDNVGNNQRQHSLAAILFDADVIKPSAKLENLRRSEWCPFYVIPGLSEALSKPLNLPKTSVIGLTSKAMEALTVIKETFCPIGLSHKAVTINRSLNASGIKPEFATPTLQTPKGKQEQKKKLNSRKKKKQRERLQKNKLIL